jgi:hypothetical protein
MPSSVIQSIDYETNHGRLTVAFKSGRVYEYYMVTPSVAAAFKAAASKGSFFNSEVRDRYTCREITPDRRLA